MKIRLTERERTILTWIVLLQYLPTSQVAVFFNGFANKESCYAAVRRSLNRLKKRGLLDAFDEPPSGRNGRPEKIYFIPARIWIPILNVLGIQDWEGYSFSIPKSSMFVSHHLGISDFILKWYMAALAKGLKSDFLAEFYMVRKSKAPEKYITIECQHPFNPKKVLRLVPDCVCTLEKHGKASLFFVEIDRGTEPMESTKYSRMDIRTKLLGYLKFLENRGFARFSHLFGYDFKGFRVLFVTNRVLSIAGLCRRSETENIVWVADIDNITKENIFDPIWVVPSEPARLPILKK